MSIKLTTLLLNRPNMQATELCIAKVPSYAIPRRYNKIPRVFFVKDMHLWQPFWAAGCYCRLEGSYIFVHELNQVYDYDLVADQVACVSNHEDKPQINGNNGSATNSDDVINGIVAALGPYIPDAMKEVAFKAAQKWYEADIKKVHSHDPPARSDKQVKFAAGQKHNLLKMHKLKSQINGNNGSATNTDDHRSNKGKARTQGKKKVRKPKSKPRVTRLPMVKRGKPMGAAVAYSFDNTRNAGNNRRSNFAMGRPIEDEEQVNLFSGTPNIPVATGSFTNQGQALLNPANSTLCPLLANIAQNFEMYKWEVWFDYEQQTNTSQTGYVGIASSPDPSIGSYSNQQQMTQQQGNTQGSPWTDKTHKCVMRSGWKLCAPNAIPTNTDPNSYYTGAVQFASGLNSSSYPMGVIWIRYKVWFKNLVNSSASSYGRLPNILPQGVFSNTTTLANPTLGLTTSSGTEQQKTFSRDNLLGYKISTTGSGNLTFTFSPGMTGAFLFSYSSIHVASSISTAIWALGAASGVVIENHTETVATYNCTGWAAIRFVASTTNSTSTVVTVTFTNLTSLSAISYILTPSIPSIANGLLGTLVTPDSLEQRVANLSGSKKKALKGLLDDYICVDVDHKIQ
jgi:hypothetical protein